MNKWLDLSTSDKIISVIIITVGVAAILTILGIFAKIFSVEKVSKNGVEFGSLSKKKPQKEERPTLMRHRFFQLMDMIKMDGYLMRNSPDSDKKIINIVFLKDCLFYTINKGLKEFFKNMEETEGKELYMLPSVILTLMDNYAEKAKSIKITLENGVTIYGVPNCYMGRFNSWNYEHHKVLMESIHDVLSDAFYTDWYIKSVACLDYLYNCYVLTIYDANRTLGQLNGNLETELELMIESQKKAQE